MERTVYASMVGDVTKRLDRIAKKAARYGVPFSYSIGAEHPQEVAVYAVDFVNHCQFVDQTYTVAAVDVTIDCEGLVKADGWRVLARIEHGADGNIVTGFGDAEIRPEWYTAPGRCDHCGTNRTRSVTFIVEHDDGTVRQVGKSCLKDYTGILPNMAIMFADVRDLFPDLDCTTEEWGERSPAIMYPTRLVLAHAFDEIAARGYVKSDARDSTRDAVADKVRDGIAPSAAGIAAAESMMAWLVERGAEDERDDAEIHALYALAFDETGDGEKAAQDRYYKKCDAVYRNWQRLGNVERDCVPFARSGYTKTSGFGRLAYMPVAYKKYLERKAVAEERARATAAAAKVSKHVGNVGDRIEFVAKKTECVTSWETMYGHTFLYKFTDESGNVYVWFASGAIRERNGITVRGTVKKHDERDGVKQTVLTRCKVNEGR